MKTVACVACGREETIVKEEVNHTLAPWPLWHSTWTQSLPVPTLETAPS